MERNDMSEILEWEGSIIASEEEEIPTHEDPEDPEDDDPEEQDNPEDEPEDDSEDDDEVEEVEAIAASSEPLTKREQALLERLEKISGERLTLGASREVTEPLARGEVPDFVGDVEIEDIFESKESLNAFAAQIYQKGAEAAAQYVMSQMPQMINTRLKRSSDLQEIVNDFYKENSDLEGMRRTVATVANEIVAEQPEIPMEQLMKEAAVRTRKLLNLPESRRNSKTPNAPGKKPAFASSKGGRKKSPKVNRDPLAREIDELIVF